MIQKCYLKGKFWKLLRKLRSSISSSEEKKVFFFCNETDNSEIYIK